MKKWFRLDTAGLIFPAIMNKRWSNVFRLSITLKEDINPLILQQAVDDCQKRFPTLYCSLHYGVFWNYLEELSESVTVQPDFAYPLTFMSLKETKKSCLRVFWYQKRIAVEFFHSLTDGSGGKVYLATLTSRYLELKKGLSVPHDELVLDLNEAPHPEESEDSFHRYCGKHSLRIHQSKAFRLKGTPLNNEFNVLTTGIVETDQLSALAHQYHCTITVFLSAVMTECLIRLQKQRYSEHHWRPIRVTLPINLRKLYGSQTLRNFVLTLDIGVNPRLGEYSLEELCDTIKHQLGYQASPKQMSCAIASNVLPQKVLPVRFAPLMIKHLLMALVYSFCGERAGCINISNLGKTELSTPLAEEVERLDFIIGVQKSYPNNCSISSVNNRTCIHMIRTIEESSLEQLFFARLVELGLPVFIECNRRY